MDQEKIGSRIIGVVVGDIEGMIAEKCKVTKKRIMNEMAEGTLI